MAKVNPLDSLVSTPVNPSNFRLPALPKLREIISSKQLLPALAQFDEEMEQWRQDAEKAINEQLQRTPTVSTGQVV